MYQTLESLPIKSSEILEIGVVTAPDDIIGPAAQKLLVHKSTEWQFHLAAALSGEIELLETRFYLGMLDGVPVGNVMTVESNGIGILGHVFTHPDHRRKGICQAIISRLMEAFRARDGSVLLLGTGFESPAYWIYHSFGFRSLKGGFMRYDTPPGLNEDNWFKPGPVSPAPLAWRHWPLLALLGAQSSGEILRSAAWKLFGIGNLETPVVRTLVDQKQEKGASGVVLETGSGTVVGCATLHPTSGGPNGWPGVWLFDHFTHANFQDKSGELLEAINWPAGKIISYVGTGAPEKATVLEAHGFEREGMVRGFLRLSDASHDVWLYGKIVS